MFFTKTYKKKIRKKIKKISDTKAELEYLKNEIEKYYQKKLDEQETVFKGEFGELKTDEEKLMDKTIDKAEKEYSKLVAKLNTKTKKSRDKLDNKHSEKIKKLKNEIKEKYLIQLKEYKNKFHDIEDNIEKVAKPKSWAEFDFVNNEWNDYKPASKEDIPNFVKIGNLKIDGKYDTLNFPALIPFIGFKNILIKTSDEQKKESTELIQLILLKILASIIPGKVKIHFIDPVGLGSNFGGFMNLPDDLKGFKALTEANRIEQRLLDITEHMENVIQKYLKNRFDSMEEYNEKAGEVAEPYQIVAVANFPNNFTEEAAKRIIKIASNGPKTGVYTIIALDKEEKLPYGFNIKDLERNCTLIEHGREGFVWKEKYFSDCKLTIERLPNLQLFDKIINLVSEKSLEAKKVAVPFLRYVPEKKYWWQKNSMDGFSVPIGRMGAKDLLNFSIGQEPGTAHHALLAGKTGSGKSNLLHILISNLAVNYSPNEIELYLIDFKKGVEFKTYATNKLPHAKVIAIQSEREFGLSVLQRLDKELQIRGDLIRKKNVANIKNYREKFSDKHMPRILLIVDEFQEFFSEDDKLASQVSIIFDRLSGQGRGLGIHILLATQSLDGVHNISRRTMSQMGVRIALQCSAADSGLILGSENDAARLLGRSGEAIYNSANGAIEANNLFQIFWFDENEKEKLLGDVSEFLSKDKKIKNMEQIIFEGDAPALISQNKELMRLIVSKTWPEKLKGINTWMGEPISIKEHTAAIFKKQSRSNLLILGQNEENAASIVLYSMISISLQSSPDSCNFYFLNLANVDEEFYKNFEDVKKILPHSFKEGKRRETISLVTEIQKLLKKRINSEKSNQEIIFFFVFALNRARDLRNVDSDILSDEPSAFSQILRDGPEFGIHTVCWCDTYANLEKVLQRQDPDEFDLRVALQMSVKESNNFIDSDLGNKLGNTRAIFSDQEKTGVLEKFRPYGLPDEDFITFLKNRFKK